MSKKLSIEKLWSYVCNGKIDKVKEYYKQGWNKNTRYDAFKIHHSLIAGAFRNKQHEIVDYLLSEGETITPDEITEILHCLSLVNDYVPLLENLKIKQLCIIRRMTGIEILKHKNMIFEGSGRKRYALIDNTQTRNDCRVTLQERINGWKPCFDKYYKIRFSAEEVDYATIKMTEYEAEIVKRVLEEANSQVEGYCGSVEFLGEVDDL